MKQKTTLTKVIGGLLICFGIYEFVEMGDHVKYYESIYDYNAKDPILSFNSGLIALACVIVIGIGAWLIHDYKSDDGNTKS